MEYFLGLSPFLSSSLRPCSVKTIDHTTLRILHSYFSFLGWIDLSEKICTSSILKFLCFLGFLPNLVLFTALVTWKISNPPNLSNYVDSKVFVPYQVISRSFGSPTNLSHRFSEPPKISSAPPPGVKSVRSLTTQLINYNFTVLKKGNPNIICYQLNTKRWK